MGWPLMPDGPAVPLWMVEGRFELRPVREADRDEILAMTAHTWDDGDYIPEVFDEWAADQRGVFAALVHTPSGRIAAIDKVSVLTPGQMWFEGLRVNPDFRGQGIASRLQTHMVGVAQAMGAEVVRFLTLTSNVPVHIAAYRDGFRIVALTRYWRWKAKDHAGPEGTALTLRLARPDEAPALQEWWRRSASYATAGLVHRRWTFYDAGTEEWVAAASEGRLLVEEEANLSEAKLPPAAVLWNSDSDENGEWWQIAATLAAPGRWTPLYAALLAEAVRRGVTEVDGMFADIHEANTGLAAAGLKPDADGERLYVFELRLDESAPRGVSA
jgi:GNAT superfamily N-acetyltransferase